MRRTALPAALLLALVVVAAIAQAPPEPPRGPFGFTLVATEDGKPASISDFFLNDDCGLCHRRQAEEAKGTFH